MMSKTLIIGAGLAGAAAARELAAFGRQVLLVEESGAIGGKVRGYGCKATGRGASLKCANCGLCLAKGLWDDVEKSRLIDIRLDTKLVDLRGEKGNYTAALKSGSQVSFETGISGVIIASGFKNITKTGFNGFVEIESSFPSGASSVIMGNDIELLMKGRTETALFEKAPGSIAFIQCFGSKDIKENAMYCSRVCCAYSTRAAKVIKQYYPDCDITFFYMEMQQVRGASKAGGGNYFDELKQLGVNFIKCRPVKIRDASPARVTFDNPETGRREELAFDLVVLSDGIRPADGAAKLAELCGLGQTEAGFLRYVNGTNFADSGAGSGADRSTDSGAGSGADCGGVYITGCAKGPAKIEEVYADSIAVARRISAGGKP